MEGIAEYDSTKHKNINRKEISNISYCKYNDNSRSPKNSTSPNEMFSDVSVDSEGSKYIEIYHANCCCPLSDDLWPIVYEKDAKLLQERGIRMFSQHPGVLPIHRVILLDWIMEVCDLYNVSRDTYYHALDFIDRYLSASNGVPKGKLQLIGITCLLMASKMEEVKSIPLVDLIFLTDGLYEEDEVIDMERNIFLMIGGKCYIWTANKWLFVYLHVLKRRLQSNEFCQVTLLLDLATLDVECLQFSYSVLAASSIFLVMSFTDQLPISSRTEYLNICECILWMEKFWKIVQKRNFKQREHENDCSHICKLYNNSVCQIYDDIIELYSKVKKERN